MLQELNKQLLIYLNSFSNNIIVENIVYIFIDLPIFFIPIFLIFYWIYYTYKEKKDKVNSKGREGTLGYNKKQDLLFIFYGTFIALLISLLIQQIIHIDRPETVIIGTGKLLLKHIPNASFPSDHATISFAFLTGIFLANYKKIGFVFLPLIIIMNISRIIAGVHWPLDILVGTIIGIIGAFISFKILNKIDVIKKINIFIIKMMEYIKL